MAIEGFQDPQDCAACGIDQPTICVECMEEGIKASFNLGLEAAAKFMLSRKVLASEFYHKSILAMRKE
jgi:hypothetical protein